MIRHFLHRYFSRLPSCCSTISRAIPMPVSIAVVLKPMIRWILVTFFRPANPIGITRIGFALVPKILMILRKHAFISIVRDPSRLPRIVVPRIFIHRLFRRRWVSARRLRFPTFCPKKSAPAPGGQDSIGADTQAAMDFIVLRVLLKSTASRKTILESQVSALPGFKNSQRNTFR